MNNEQPHDPTVTLRLELGRVTDQRNAYEAALRKDVLKVIYDATLAADAGFADTVGDLEKEVSDLRADNARLQSEYNEKAGLCRSVMAEARRLRKAGDDLADALGDTSLSDKDMDKLTGEWDKAVKEVQA